MKILVYKPYGQGFKVVNLPIKELKKQNITIFMYPWGVYRHFAFTNNLTGNKFKSESNKICNKCQKNTPRGHLIFRNPKWRRDKRELICYLQIHSLNLCNLTHYMAIKSNVTLNNNDRFLCETCLFEASLKYKDFETRTDREMIQ